jgi:hypothetical protein
MHGTRFWRGNEEPRGRRIGGFAQSIALTSCDLRGRHRI